MSPDLVKRYVFDDVIVNAGYYASTGRAGAASD